MNTEKFTNSLIATVIIVIDSTFSLRLLQSAIRVETYKFALVFLGTLILSLTLFAFVFADNIIPTLKAFFIDHNKFY